MESCWSALDKTPLVPARRGGVRAHIPRSHCVNAWQRVRSGVRVPNLRQSVRPAPNNPLVIRSKINRKTSPNSTPLSDDRAWRGVGSARGRTGPRPSASCNRPPRWSESLPTTGSSALSKGEGRPRGLRTDVLVTRERVLIRPLVRQKKESRNDIKDKVAHSFHCD